MSAVKKPKPSARVLDMSDEDLAQLNETQADVEKAVLGSMILDNDQIITWRTVGAAHPQAGCSLFRFSRHQDILRAILAVSDSGRYADFTTVIAEMATTGTLRNAGGPGYVASLEQHVFSTLNCRDHIGTLVKHYRKIEAENMGVEIAERARNGEDINALVVEIQERSRKLQSIESRMYTPTVDLLAEAYERLTTDDTEMKRTIPSCFPTLNQMIGGYVRQQMHLIGAPPGNGKTAFLMQEIDLFLQAGLTVDAFLMESDLAQVVARYNSRIYGIPGRSWNTKFFTKLDRQNAYNGTKAFSHTENKLFLAPRGLYSALDIEAMVDERIAQTGKPSDVIVVDYLSRLSATRKDNQAASWEGITENVEQLWAMFARKNAVGLVAEQLRIEDVRHSFSKKTRLPTQGAFRYGSPTQAAKVALILHKNDQDMISSKQVIEQLMVLVKANDGETGAIPSLFIKPLAMHIEDDGTPSGRFPHKEHLNKFGYDIGTRRTDTTREES